MTIDLEKQKRVIQFLLADWSKGKREQMVFEQFVQELKDEGRVGIQEQLQKIRQSDRIREAHAATYGSLDAIVSSALGEMSLGQLEKLLPHIKPTSGEPN